MATLKHGQCARCVELAAEIERLRSAIAWMENLDPPLVEAALARFALILQSDVGNARSGS